MFDGRHESWGWDVTGTRQGDTQRQDDVAAFEDYARMHDVDLQ
jgi:hypothetical protein